MELLDLIADAHDGRGLESIGHQFGLDDRQTKAALEQLAPAIAAGLRRNASSYDGLTSLLGALQRGQHDRYLDEPELVQLGNVRSDGNAILGHIFGSKDVSRGVAMHAASGTGIGGAILKQLLPIIASMVLGAITKKMSGGARRMPQPQPQPQPRGGLDDILGDVLGGGRGGTRQTTPGGGGLGDILSDILGGGARRGQHQAEQPDMTFNEETLNRGRDVLDDFLGRGSSSGNAADDLLNSVERRIRRG
jgi:hypothetical protein